MNYLILIILIVLGLSVNSQTDNKFNFDFEKQNPDEQLPEGWFKWGDYTLGSDSISHSGKLAGKITSVENGKFGSIAYKIPANYKGRTIQLEGYMKTKKIKNGFAGLLLRIDGNGKKLAFDNMHGRKIDGTNDWKKYELNILYPEGAEKIYVGGILVGKGEAWFDDFTVTIDREDIQTLKEVEELVLKTNLNHEFDGGSKIEFSELNEDLIANLELLGRVWGFLKYYHPEIGKGNYNWDYELFRVLPEYLNSTNILERDRILVEWIEKYGVIDKCEKCEETSSKAVLKPDLSWIKNNKLNLELENKLFEIYQNRHQGEHFYVQMKKAGNPDFINENLYAKMPYPDSGFRLLSLYRYWNMINYFFPYKHLMDKDWNQTLKEYIPIFINAKSELEYELAAIQIIGDIKDTHANLWGGDEKINIEKGEFYPSFRVQFIEEKLVVTDYYNPELKKTSKLSVGDIITHINKTSVKNIIDSLSKYYPASNNAARMRNISIDILRSTEREINLEYLSNGGKEQHDFVLYPKDSLKLHEWFKKGTEKCYKLINKDIGYITLKSIKDEDITKIKELFKTTKGIIIDIRNYPSTFVPFSLGSFFVDTLTPFVKFTNGNINNPGEFTFTKELSIPNSSETYKGKLIVIVNEISQSNAEYTAMAFKAGRNTTIIGSTTAGADGNVSEILLPGGLRTKISGIGVYYPNGTETQRIGIVPDIEVKPTINGIKEGKDELLEKAIELIK